MNKLLTLCAGAALMMTVAEVKAQDVFILPVPERHASVEDNLRAEIEILRNALVETRAELIKAKMLSGAPDAMALAELNDNGLKHVLEGDYESAVLYFRRAFEHDYIPAISNLGMMYLNGTGVPKDSRQATALLERAAKGGNMVAAENLGRAYEFGLGVGFNRHKAIDWYQKAERMGSAQAREAIARLKR